MLTNLPHMAAPPTLFIVCSDHPHNGKTLLARVLVDYLLAEEHDPFCFDLAFPEGGLRAYFPGRTALVDFTTPEGREKVFGTLLARAGRDYVIDVPAQHLAEFCEAAAAIALTEKAQGRGFRIVVLYIVDREEKSLSTAMAVDDILQPDVLVPVANRLLGSALPDGVPGPVLRMEALDPEVRAIVANRRFSLRLFMLGEEADLAPRHKVSLNRFLLGLMKGFRSLEAAAQGV